MIPFLMKDVLLFWRDRKEVIISLLLPIILTTVLGLAMPGWVENTSKSKTVLFKAAIVNLDNERAALEQMEQSEAFSQLPAEQAVTMRNQMAGMAPIRLLQQLFDHEELKETISVITMSSEEAMKQLDEGKIKAVVTVPDGFTLDALNKMLFNKGDGATLAITAERTSMQVDILTSVIGDYLQQMNLQTAISHSRQLDLDSDSDSVSDSNFVLGSGLDFANNSSELGGRETIPGVNMVTSFQYYALALAIIFALMVSATTAAKSTAEKRERTFQRMLLTGSHPMKYLLGKIISSCILSIILLVFVLLVTHFIFGIFTGRSFGFWIGILAIVVMLSVCVGALASLFTVLLFRMKESSATGITFMIIMVTGTIGGSFVPIYVLPEWLRRAGEWTPNGLALSTSLEWIQSEMMGSLVSDLITMAIFALLIIGVSVWSFPRKGQI